MVRYVNTAQTVEEIMEIVERVGEWREPAAKEVLVTSIGEPLMRQEILERVAWKRGEEKLQFWGFSYGTLLGQTFAAMHPARIHRMVIDGVLDAKDNYGGSWLANLIDSDKIVSKFCDYCYEAGPDRCPLFTGRSPRDIESRFEEIMMGLKESPISMPTRDNQGPSVVTYGNIHLHMITAMAFSHGYAEDFFSLLANIHARNATAIENVDYGTIQPAQRSEECLRDGPFSDACVTGNYVSIFGSFQAISCMDTRGSGAPRFTKKEFQQYTEALELQSKYSSPNWARNKLACVGYEFGPA